jgi:activator of HSP90 ATPase
MSEWNSLVAWAGIPSRRQIIAGVAVSLGRLALGPPVVRDEDEEISHAAESIHLEPTFKASHKAVYEALMNSAQFDKVIHLGAAMGSGMSLGTATTNISPQAGGTFTIFGGHIVGRHIELVPNERIVQAWRVVDWGPGLYSIARFELVEQGSGTKIIFDHTGFPKGQAEHLAAGWKGNYWEPLAKVLA